jgi:hypothetical protein
VDDALRVSERKDTAARNLTRRERCDWNEKRQRMQGTHANRVCTEIGVPQVGKLGRWAAFVTGFPARIFMKK